MLKKQVFATYYKGEKAEFLCSKNCYLKKFDGFAHFLKNNLSH